VKILVFEYITGGGFNKQELPDSLAGEGRLMLNALLDNLARLPELDITVMMDGRLCESISKVGINIAVIRPEHDISDEFARLVNQSDLVWPIAPEFDGILQALCQTVESLGKILLTSTAAAVSIAGNKFKTYVLLNRHQITAVPTWMFKDEYSPGEWMVKPVDGVGCADSYVVTNREEFERMIGHKGSYIIQPHLQGAKTSLSCLFKQGRGWLICANLQYFELADRQYQLASIVVNNHSGLGFYQSVIDKIACAMPGLWGYVGIDLIETATQTWVLEINPRLTTSFAGIYEALGINVVEAVLQLLHGEPMLKPTCNKAITVQVKQMSVGTTGPSSLQSVGWDIGGAHVKAAVIKDGEIIAVYQQPCPLWKGLDQLHRAVNAIMPELAGSNRHAITMTGELVDLFDNRDDGVRQIIQTMTGLLSGAEILVFAGKEGFLKPYQVEAKHYSSIASANWLASALFAAQRVGSGLFVDCGSTTTDILLLKDGQVLADGYTDYLRLISQELIYTGIVRTAVMAVTQTALDQGEKIGLMAEYFATMADVYRVTGELNDAHDQADTADGAEKTVLASARRLSRMIGCDFHPEELPRWQQFAEDIRARQLQQIQQGCVARLSLHEFPQNNPLIGAGVGRFLVKQIAVNLGRPYLDFSDLLPIAIIGSDITAADCAPAAAVAYLADRLSNHL
jgi:probable H4MPT-linked C1 transfer pathway protein